MMLQTELPFDPRFRKQSSVSCFWTLISSSLRTRTVRNHVCGDISESHVSKPNALVCSQRQPRDEERARHASSNPSRNGLEIHSIREARKLIDVSMNVIGKHSIQNITGNLSKLANNASAVDRQKFVSGKLLIIRSFLTNLKLRRRIEF
jgi:hypothetical protein